MNFDSLNINQKMEILDHVARPIPMDWVFPTETIPEFFEQLIKIGYLENLNIIPGQVNLRPTPEFQAECETWDVNDLNKQSSSERMRTANMSSGKDLGLL